MDAMVEFSPVYVLLVTAGMTFAIWLLAYRARRATDLKFIYSKLADFNQTSGTAFPINRQSKPAQMLGILGYSDTHCLIFDIDKRKVAISTRGVCELENFDYLQEWQLIWVEKQFGKRVFASDIRLVIYTTDPQHPSLIVRVPTLEYGKAWESKLVMLIFNGYAP